MDVGILLVFQNYLGRGEDTNRVEGEIRLASSTKRRAEEVLPELHSC